MNKPKVNRSQRVGDMLQQSLANILLKGVGDRRFQFVTVTGVDVSRDLSYAKVYVSVLLDEDEEIKTTILALNRAASFLRHQLAKEVMMRVVPTLKFHYDASTAYGFRLNNLLNDTEANSDSEDK